ncbi:dynein regulatory complex protein 9 [Episyrphus balteatus]|uniref:dynein regulatory complex protein 9 n=1 Tax=Episyrphus balteatus TaxID=286459 RepID=UPI0024867EEC|nr:dynein regulatory complex protein 9 [Episyrphus balteatus]
MDTFLRDAVTTVVTLSLNELIVLSHGKHLRSSTGIFQEKDTTNKPSEKKTGSGVELLAKSNLPIATLNEIKLNNELKKLIDIYIETMEELQNTGTIETLLATINQQIAKNKEQDKVIQEHNSSTLVLKNLKTKLTDFKSEAEEKLLKASETLNILKSDWRIISKVNELEYELVKKWEHTRFTQAVVVGEKEEENLEKMYAKFVAKTNTEQRVIFDFEAFSRRQFDKYSDMIEMWKKKYSTELSKLLINIKEKENKIKEVNKTYKKHYEIFCKRKMFIKEYMEQKAEQNRLYQLQMLRIQSAVKIQAWWRGLMVRRCLGPFRKKTKKNKKGKKSK